ncbi:helix-turn-helix domain-containing protein, partial [bacterium]|nr:helix-turn-helix domain-containing protein [bacterium]
MTNNTVTNPIYVRKSAMAKALGVSQRTLENWMATRIVPYQKIGKVVCFDPDAVKSTIAERYTVTHL